MVKTVYHMYICNVRVDKVTREEALQKVREFLASGGQHRLFTPNPEMVVAAQRDSLFLDILNRGALNICDGTGLALVSGGVLQRLPGIDFVQALCAEAARAGQAVFLLGSGKREVVEAAAAELRELYPTLQIVGTHPGVSLTHEPNKAVQANADDHNELLGTIIAAAPQILLVGFGHGKQEKWIDQFLKELPSVRLAMGVGGTFEVLAGAVRRAPRWLRVLGLEWLWRLCIQPWRFWRIWTATVVFLWYNIFYKKIRRV